MNFNDKFVLFLFIFFKFIVPQIDKNIFKVSSKDLGTRTSRQYKSERYLAGAKFITNLKGGIHLISETD